jgi:hypothetical protein
LRGAYVSAQDLLVTLSEHGRTATENQYGYFYESNDYENPLHFLAPLLSVLCEYFSYGAVLQLKPIRQTQQDMGSSVYESGAPVASQASAKNPLKSVRCENHFKHERSIFPF